MVSVLGMPSHRNKITDSDTAVGSDVVVRTAFTPHYSN